MQDRFKFRTYLPDLKFFKYWGWIEDSHYVDLCACGDYQKPELLEKYTNQCTGLKDKNGKLIYEGDILKAYFDSDTGKTCFEYVPVGYDEEKLAFYTGKKFRALFAEGYFIPEEYEIVGNIYENKELLE